MTPANKNLLLRVLSALVLAPPLLWVILHPRPEGLALVVHAAGAIAQGEFYWMALRDDPVWLRLVGVLLGLVVTVTLFWAPGAGHLAAVLVGATLAASIVQLFGHKQIERAASNTATLLFGILYVPLLVTSVALAKRLPSGSGWVVLSLTISWLSDTAAYFVGRAVGRHRLYPAISPGKSIEGAVGGIFGAFVATTVAKLWYLPALRWIDAVLLAVVGSVLGQLGDLVESMLKRSYGVKDSGRILPGHGGILDRIDALLFVAPFVYIYATYVVLGAL